MVTARYIAPVSRCRNPSRSAHNRAVVLFPEPAGPSIARTKPLVRFTGALYQRTARFQADPPRGGQVAALDSPWPRPMLTPMEPGPAVPTQREECLPVAGSPDSADVRTEAGISPGISDQRRRHGWWLAVLFLSFVGADLVLLATNKYGAGLSPDSVSYFDVARSLESGKGFVFHTGEPLVWWAPLYSVLLALIGFATRLDPSAFARLLNSVLFALVIYLSARLLRTDSRQSLAYSLLGVCAVLFSKPLAEVYAMAWSETLFIPLVLVYLMFAQRYWRHRDLPALGVMALTTALACLTRYIGVALALAGAATIILTAGVRLRTRITRSLAFTALSLAPLGLWLLRNYRLTATWAGDRGDSGFTLLQQAARYIRTVTSWYSVSPVSVPVVAGTAAVLAVTFLSWKAARRRLLGSLRVVTRDHLPVVLFIATFSLVLAAASMRDADVNSRMLSPLFIPATVVLLELVWNLMNATGPTPGVTSGRLSVALLALWLCIPLYGVAVATAGRLRTGAGGYTTDSCRASPTIACARQVLSENRNVRVYSNGPDVLWEFAGIDAEEVPRRAKVSLTRLGGRWPPEDRAFLVWFRPIAWRRYEFSVRELQAVADIQEVAHLQDGAVYWVTPRGTPFFRPGQ